MEVKHTPEMEIIEGNKLIAEFMGYRFLKRSVDDKPWFEMKDSEKPQYDGWYNANENIGTDLKYHTSWDWLMPVLEKIEEMKFNITIKCEFDDPDNLQTCMINNMDDCFIKFSEFDLRKIQVVYLSVVEFIKWYNQSAITKATK